MRPSCSVNDSDSPAEGQRSPSIRAGCPAEAGGLNQNAMAVGARTLNASAVAVCNWRMLDADRIAARRSSVSMLRRLTDAADDGGAELEIAGKGIALTIVSGVVVITPLPGWNGLNRLVVGLVGAPMVSVGK